MNTKPLMLALTSVAVLFCGPATPSTSAQPVIPPPTPAYYQPLSDQQLDELLGPIALYPDPLLAVLLPAATFPAQIVLADRYVTRGGDPYTIDLQPWDPSVQALARYPSVLKYMDDNLGWTTELGQAFTYQQSQVMDSIQRLRLSAQNFGNLMSTPQEQVVDYGGEIEILPAEPEVIYVPDYQPAYVYCRSGFVCGFNFGFTIGPWLDCDFDWRRHHLCFWDHDHPRPDGWWHGRPDWRDNWIAHEGNVWRPGDHRDGYHDRNHWGDRDGHDWNHAGNHDWNHSGDHNWNQAVNNTPPSHNSVVWMSRPGASPRPAATPRPAANHPGGSIYVANPPAPASRPDYGRGEFAGGERWNNAGNFNHGHDAMPTVNRAEPTWSAPAHSAPSASYSHSESSFHGGGGYSGGGGGGGGYRGGGGSGGNSGGGGGGSHGSSSQSQSRH